ILIRMDPGWTQFEKTYFSVPGRWSSPQGAPRWKRIVALDSSDKELDAQPGSRMKVAAAELEFPGAKWNLAFKFEPAQEVTFNGTEFKFSIGSLTNDNWQVVFAGQAHSKRGAASNKPVWRRPLSHLANRSRRVQAAQRSGMTALL